MVWVLWGFGLSGKQYVFGFDLASKLESDLRLLTEAKLLAINSNRMVQASTGRVSSRIKIIIKRAASTTLNRIIV